MFYYYPVAVNNIHTCIFESEVELHTDVVNHELPMEFQYIFLRYHEDYPVVDTFDKFLKFVEDYNNNDDELYFYSNEITIAIDELVLIPKERLKDLDLIVNAFGNLGFSSDGVLESVTQCFITAVKQLSTINENNNELKYLNLKEIHK